MFPETSNILLHIMTHLKDVRKVTEVHILQNNAVRITIEAKLFDIRGTHPLFSVHEIERSCMSGSKAAYEIERQLNGNPFEEEGEYTPSPNDEKYNELLCAHVDSMLDEDVKKYNEECGGPDLDSLDVQRTWLKTHFIFIGHNIVDIMEKVEFMEGRARRSTLSKSFKEQLWAD